jgi:hypothetical protein
MGKMPAELDSVNSSKEVILIAEESTENLLQGTPAPTLKMDTFHWMWGLAGLPIRTGDLDISIVIEH